MNTTDYVREFKLYQKRTILHDGRYRIERVLGGGGQGHVYLAWDFVDQVRVVMKVSPSDQLRDEGWLLSRFDDNGIPHVHKLFEENQRFHLVMDYIEGVTLLEYVDEQGPLPSAEVLTLATALSELLTVLHSAHPPVVHGDVKPNNVMIDREGGVYLVDFGIAECVTPSPPRLPRKMYGTSGFVAPERSFRHQIVPRGDVYSLGATLHYAATGDAPPAGLPGQFFFRPLDGSLGRLIMQMLEHEPNRRPQSATLTRRLQTLGVLQRVSLWFPFLADSLGQRPLLSVRDNAPVRRPSLKPQRVER